MKGLEHGLDPADCLDRASIWRCPRLAAQPKLGVWTKRRFKLAPGRLGGTDADECRCGSLGRSRRGNALGLASANILPRPNATALWPGYIRFGA